MKAHQSMQPLLQHASIDLSIAQDLAEDNQREYSEKTWSLITDALAILSKLEEMAQEEETTPLEDR
jgi:hypothetical protein